MTQEKQFPRANAQLAQQYDELLAKIEKADHDNFEELDELYSQLNELSSSYN